MNDFLVLQKIMKDTLALYKSSFVYITALISAVIVPYTLLIRAENLPNEIVYIIPIFILLLMVVEIVSTKLASAGYIEFEFNMANELKNSLRLVLPYTLITLLAMFATFVGLSFFIIPGIAITIFFNILKIDFIINGGLIRDRFKSSLTLLNGSSFLKIAKIYILPLIIQLAIAFIITPYVNPDTLEAEIERIYPYMSAGLIIIFPVTICFRTSIYFNNIKQRHLEAPNELV